VSLKLAYCDSKAATYAVMNWHYSKRMPIEPLVKVGVWEDAVFIGVVLFGRGASYNLGDSWGLEQTEIAELVRVALNKHKAPVSKIVSIAVRLFKKASPGTKLIVSFADPEEGHHGGIYQAMGWKYVGKTEVGKQYFHEGRWKHNRTLTADIFGNKPKVTPEQLKKLPVRLRTGKLRYVIALDESMTDMVNKKSLPYPKRMTCGSPKGASGDQPGKGGAKPTLPLHSEEKPDV